MSKMIMENYCSECGELIHTIVDENEYASHKAGQICCPHCGAYVMPCNECADHTQCDNCPYKKSQILLALSDCQYVTYLKEYDPKSFEAIKNDKSNYYHLIIESENL